MALAQYNRTEAWQQEPGEHRVFTRVPFAHPVRWLTSDGDSGMAAIRDVSRSGVGLRLGRFLRPGPIVQLCFDDIEYGGAPVQVQASTVWCRPEAGALDRFVAGFKIVQGERHTLGAISEIFYSAIGQYADEYLRR